MSPYVLSGNPSNEFLIVIGPAHQLTKLRSPTTSQLLNNVALTNDGRARLSRDIFANKSRIISTYAIYKASNIRYL